MYVKSDYSKGKNFKKNKNRATSFVYTESDILKISSIYLFIYVFISANG